MGHAERCSPRLRTGSRAKSRLYRQYAPARARDAAIPHHRLRTWKTPLRGLSRRTRQARRGCSSGWVPRRRFAATPPDRGSCPPLACGRFRWVRCPAVAPIECLAEVERRSFLALEQVHVHVQRERGGVVAERAGDLHDVHAAQAGGLRTVCLRVWNPAHGTPASSITRVALSRHPPALSRHPRDCASRRVGHERRLRRSRVSEPKNASQTALSSAARLGDYRGADSICSRARSASSTPRIRRR